MDKVCSSCKLSKGVNQFNKNKTKLDGLNTFCKSCSRRESREYYHAAPLKHRKNVKESQQRNFKRNQEYVWQWLSEHPCVDCGEDNIIVLEFDHLRDKDRSISQAVIKGWSLKRIQAEIDKCEVRCANCHRIKTAYQHNWGILNARLRGVNG